MEKTFLFFALAALVLVSAGGCTQQPSESNNLPPMQNSDRNFFQRPCNTDADCVQSQGQRQYPRDANAPMDNNFGRGQGNNPCGNDATCLQRMQDFNRQRTPPVLKCVSGYCRPVLGGQQ